MELPDTDPVYMIARDPTVPKRIRSPVTVPLMVVAPGDVERLIVPVSFDVDCVHLSMNVPVYAPLNWGLGSQPRQMHRPSAP